MNAQRKAVAVLVPFGVVCLLTSICPTEEVTVQLENSRGYAAFTTTEATEDKLWVQSDDPKKKIKATSAQMVYGDDGSRISVHKTNKGVKIHAATVNGRKGVSLYRVRGVYVTEPVGGGAPGGPGAKGTKPTWTADYGKNLLEIYYIGGSNSADGTQEALTELRSKYIMKGYILKVQCPPIKTGTSVT